MFHLARGSGLRGRYQATANRLDASPEEAERLRIPGAAFHKAIASSVITDAIRMATGGSLARRREQRQPPVRGLDRCSMHPRCARYAPSRSAIDGILHYCVANMPGAVPVTATRALTNATLPYVRRLASVGVDAALAEDPGFARGLNVKDGEITYAPVAEAYAQGPPVAAW